MNSILIMVVIVVLTVVFVFMVTSKNPIVEKYKKYAFILLPAILILILLLLTRKKVSDSDKTEFVKKLEDVKDDIQEAKTIAEVKTQYIKAENTEKMKQLDEVTAIPDKVERRKKLAEMIG